MLHKLNKLFKRANSSTANHHLLPISIALRDHKNAAKWLLYHYRSVELFNIATDQWALSQAHNTSSTAYTD